MSIKVSQSDVEKIAALARLTLTPAEVGTATQDLSRVLEHFSTLQKIATAGVPTSDDVSGLKNVARDDVAQSDVLGTAADVMGRAPDVLDNHLKVPAVF